MWVWSGVHNYDWRIHETSNVISVFHGRYYMLIRVCVHAVFFFYRMSSRILRAALSAGVPVQ